MHSHLRYLCMLIKCPLAPCAGHNSMTKRYMRMYDDIRRWLTEVLDSRGKYPTERICQMVYLVGVAMIVVGLPLHMFGILGLADASMLLLTAAAWVITVGVFVCYLMRWLSLYAAISTFTIVQQMAQSVRVVYLSVVMPPGYTDAIILNQIVSLIIIIYLALGFVRAVPTVNTVMSIATLIFAHVVTHGAVSRQMVVLFLFVEVVTCIIGRVMRVSVSRLQRENTERRSEQEGVLNALHMSKPEFDAFVELCRDSSASGPSVRMVFDRLDERSEVNLIRAVEHRMAERQLRSVRLAEHFPQLTPTELEVCRLVVAGKTLGEIAQVLRKSVNNVSSVRIHVRKKLGLRTGDDLRDVLCAVLSGRHVGA